KIKPMAKTNKNAKTAVDAINAILVPTLVLGVVSVEFVVGTGPPRGESVETFAFDQVKTVPPVSNTARSSRTGTNKNDVLE
ncbi:13211_t:CDS:2, partial [Racocetra fulgida]